MGEEREGLTFMGTSRCTSQWISWEERNKKKNAAESRLTTKDWLYSDE